MIPCASAGRSASSSSRSGRSIRSRVVGSSAVTDAVRGSGTSAASSPTVDPAPRSVTIALAVMDADSPAHDGVQVLLHRTLGDDERSRGDVDLGGAPSEGRQGAARDVGEQADALERDDALDGGHRHRLTTVGCSRAASSSTRSGRSQARA